MARGNNISLSNVFLLFCCALLTRPALCANTEVDVLILGGGITGITAANYLQNNGQTDFLILEAQDYIGGRIKQVKVGNVTVGEGANWVHYVEEGDENPILGFAKSINLKGYPTNYSDINLRNSIHDKEDYKETFKVFKDIEEKILEQNEKNPRNGDLPLSAVLAANGWLPDTPLKRTVDWYLDFEYAVKPSLISTRHYTGVPKENDFVTDTRGFTGIVNYLVQNFTNKIKTNKTVRQIEYNSSGIVVHTSNGEIYTAKYGLCTFSTGVLASNLVTFVPELPEWKIEAISRIPLAYYTNIYVKFPRVFWEENEFIYNAGSVHETFPLVLNLNKKGIHEGSNLLLFTALEENSLRIEKQTDNETKAEVMKTLEKMYPNISIPEPTELYVSRFSQNPYIRGSYSNAVVGSVSADFENLLGRLGDLFFAGEAADEEYWGYLQGGYLTALRQAKVILNCLKEKECPDYKPKETDVCQTKNAASTKKTSFAFIFLFLSVVFM